MADSLAARANDLASRREPFVHATVVRAQHPTSAHAGDTALVLPSGDIQGFVGGNCVESSVREYSLQVLASQEPLLLRVVPGEPSRTAEEGAVEVSNPCLSGGAIEIFLQPRIPAPRVLVVGTTPGGAGPGDPRLRRGPGRGTHRRRIRPSAGRRRGADCRLARQSRGGRAGGGPARRSARMSRWWPAGRGAPRCWSPSTSTPAQRSRVFTPAGLQLGARTPGEIALSILAQLIQERAKSRHAAPAAASGRCRARQAGARSPAGDARSIPSAA